MKLLSAATCAIAAVLLMVPSVHADPNPITLPDDFNVGGPSPPPPPISLDAQRICSLLDPPGSIGGLSEICGDIVCTEAKGSGSTVIWYNLLNGGGTRGVGVSHDPFAAPGWYSPYNGGFFHTDGSCG